MERRPILARSSAWARAGAAALARAGLSPNLISTLSVAAAVLGAGCYVLARSDVAWLFGAALAIQLRLLCNLFDGMVAIEGGQRTPVGELYNELPDRVADTLFFVGAGYATPWPWLGWLAAVLAVATAYVRAFGAALGQGNDYSGPMAKQQRMAALTAASLAAPLEVWIVHRTWVLPVALALIAGLTAWTCVRRTRRLAARLRQAAAAS